jgi:exodeoxyribonuclease V alpha subunit
MNFQDISPTYRQKNLTPEMLTGIVERITFHAEESGYTVARLQCPRARDLVTVVGNFANIQAG